MSLRSDVITHDPVPSPVVYAIAGMHIRKEKGWTGFCIELGMDVMPADVTEHSYFVMSCSR
jgi:hypothetical protein